MDLNAVRMFVGVLQGQAVGVLAPYCVAPALASGALVEILADEPRHTHPVHLIYPAHKHPSALLENLRGLLPGAGGQSGTGVRLKRPLRS